MPDFEERAADWLDLDDARARCEAVGRAARLPPLRLPAAQGVGRALAQGIRAPRSLPRWRTAGMDGYAMRSVELRSGVSFPVAGVVFPGRPRTDPVPPGHALRIMTGGRVPEGFDSVIRVEDSDREASGQGVIFTSLRDSGRNVRAAGIDVGSGVELMAPGDLVSPGRLAVLAACGIRDVEVHPGPVPALLTTGDELRDPWECLDPEDPGTPDSSLPLLEAEVRSLGLTPVSIPRVGDSLSALRTALAAAIHAADLLVICGGASMGEADQVKRALDSLGFRPDFWRIRIRPGSPFGLGVLRPADGRTMPVVNLPGNPASTFVTWHLLVAPLIRAMGGARKTRLPSLSLRASAPIPGAPGSLVHLPRVEIDFEADPWTVRLAGDQGSGHLLPQSRADGIAEIPPGIERVEAGDPVRVHLLPAATGPVLR